MKSSELRRKAVGLCERGFIDRWELFELILDAASGAGGWCEVCGKDGKECAQCKGAVYCGKKHQFEDWSVHKKW